MRRALLRNLSLYSHKFSSSSSYSHIVVPNHNYLPPYTLPKISNSYTFKFFSTIDNNNNNNNNNDNNNGSFKENGNDNGNGDIKSCAVENVEAESQIEDPTADVEDVSNEELKTRIEKYFKGDEEALESVLEAILSRKLKGDHEETDEELVDELEWTPLDKVDDEEFESGFETEHETDEDIDNLYSAQDIVVDDMIDRDGDGEKGGHGDDDDDDDDRILFNPNEKVWAKAMHEYAEIAAEIAPGSNMMDDFRELEEILEDMRDWDKLLPDEIKSKVKAKFDELGDKCERQELEPEEAYEHFKEFEDQIVADHIQKVEKEEESPESEAVTKPVDEKKSDDPPGVGPILRWHQRIVFAPGGDAWHPKNRKVKLSVKVKELGLTKYQFRRFREIVGKRYHPGKDELTITSERFEHREENRKDCLRTLLNIVEEAGKATAIVEEARTSYVKQRLKANPAFMARLQAKTKRVSAPIPA